MPQHEGKARVGTKIGEPRPGEHTFDRHDKTIAVGGDRLEKRFRGRLHILVQHHFPVVVHDTDVHTPGMQIDTAVKWVLIVVESHEASSSFVSDLVSKSAYHWGMLRGRPQSLSTACSRHPPAYAPPS